MNEFLKPVKYYNKRKKIYTGIKGKKHPESLLISWFKKCYLCSGCALTTYLWLKCNLGFLGKQFLEKRKGDEC